MVEQLPINIINLPHRIERREQAEQQVKEQGAYARFWEGIVNRHNRKEGVCKAHKQIVRDAKECGYKQVVIAEDDILFFQSKNGELAWDYFLKSIPEDYDLFLAMCYVCDLSKDNRITGVFSSLTLYVINERFYDFYLSIPDDCHIDRHLGLTSNIHKYFVAEKFCCYQDGSRSDNSFLQCDYSPYLVGRKIFGQDD